MAFLRLGCIKEGEKGNRAGGLSRAIDYIYREEKTEGKYMSSYFMGIAENDLINLNVKTFQEMMETKMYYNKPEGRQGYHYKLSFPMLDKVTPTLAMQITKEFIEKCFSEYEVAYSVHTDSNYIHSHMVFNSVNKVTGLKYRYNNGDWARYLQPVANDICKKHGLTGLALWTEDEKVLIHRSRSHDYGTWIKKNKGEDAARKEKNKYRNERILRDIDSCIQKAKNNTGTYEEFISLMEKKGHIINDNNKHMTVLAPGREKPARTDTLNKEYTKENMIKMINGTYQKLDADTVRKRLFSEMDNLQKVRTSAGMITVFDTAAFIKEKELTTYEQTTRYYDYLCAANKELCKIRNRINISYNARADAISMLSELIGLYNSYKCYKSGDLRFKNEYDRALFLFRELKEDGYNIEALYQFHLQAKKCLKTIDDYKKHIFIEKKICEKVKKEFAREVVKQKQLERK